MTPNHANSQNQLRTPTVLMCRLAAVHVPLDGAYKIWILAQISTPAQTPTMQFLPFFSDY